MTTTLAELLKDSTYKLTQFKPEHIKTLSGAVDAFQARRIF